MQLTTMIDHRDEHRSFRIVTQRIRLKFRLVNASLTHIIWPVDEKSILANSNDFLRQNFGLICLFNNIDPTMLQTFERRTFDARQRAPNLRRC